MDMYEVTGQPCYVEEISAIPLPISFIAALASVIFYSRDKIPASHKLERKYNDEWYDIWYDATQI